MIPRIGAAYRRVGHVHALLPRGAQILDEQFPGVLDELVADGAPVWDDAELSKLYLSYGGHEVLRSGKLAVDHKAFAMYMPSRPFLECHVRRRLKAIDNVTIPARTWHLPRIANASPACE